MNVTVIVLAKRPRAGFVKTRMVPQLSFEAAAEVAAAALRDTLAAVGAGGFRRCVLSFDGDGDGWVPDGWVLHAQPTGGLDERIVKALEDVPDGPVLLVGMDTPQLSARALHTFDPLRYDACLGLATDGGYWVIGFADTRDAAASVLGVPMSEATTGAEQLRRLQARGLRVQLLEELHDVDTVEVARRVAAQAPNTEFARTLRSVLPGAVA
jgi:glycosyltransferase A (GT-A) superfamily protein (DUF2064 family)